MNKVQIGSNEKEATVKMFKASTQEIIRSIINQTELEGINLSIKVQDPHFRFRSLAENEQDTSCELSEAFATVARLIKTRDTRVAVEKSIERRIDKADDFATEMYDVIESMRAESGIMTNKAMVDLLNNRGISTYNKAKWHTSTLNNLRKRWSELGLVAPVPVPK